MNFETFSPQTKEIEEEDIERQTPSHLVKYGEKVVDIFCKSFSCEGLEHVKEAKESYPDTPFIISSSHLHNLDVPAALKALGREFDIQLSGESVLLEKMKYLAHRLMISLAGKDNFTPLDYVEDKEGKHGSFNPDNFEQLAGKIADGKTPWIAAHPFALDGKMRRPGLGAVYLAAKTGAAILPTALEVKGESVMEGAVQTVKNLLERPTAIYHIGEALKLTEVDVTPIEDVIRKRREGKPVSEEEIAWFSESVAALRQNADTLCEAIAALLPPEKSRQ
ncbi:MAG: hypothetical protein ACM3PZ_03430 [Bacillota bacterium]